jgi:hypothetical protein
MSNEGYQSAIAGGIWPAMPKEVLEGILAYSKGLPGAIVVLTNAAKKNGVTTLEELRAIVGYPLEEATLEKASDLWGRLKKLYGD